jgi:hypothetical protein
VAAPDRQATGEARKGTGVARPLDDPIETSVPGCREAIAPEQSKSEVLRWYRKTAAQGNARAGGIYSLAAIIGVTDVDPFVLNLVQGGVGELPSQVVVVAILIASSSNNLLKGMYTVIFAEFKEGMMPLAALVILACFGFCIAAQMAGVFG